MDAYFCINLNCNVPLLETLIPKCPLSYTKSITKVGFKNVNKKTKIYRKKNELLNYDN